MKISRVLPLAVIALFVVIVLLPIFLMLVAPVVSQDLASHASLFNQRHLSLSWNSLVLATGTTALCLVVGVPLAFFLQKTDLRGRRFFRIVYLIPILIPPYIHAIVWTRLGDFLSAVDIHNLLGAIFVSAIAYFPFVTLTTMKGLTSIDHEMEESSILCHGALRTIRGITLPLSSPHVLCGALFVFIITIIDFGVPDIFRVRVYAVEIFIHFSALYDERTASFLSYPLIVVTLLAVLLQKRYMRDRAYVSIGAGRGKTVSYNLGTYHPLALAFTTITMILSVVVPIALLFKESGSLENYFRVFSTSIDQIAYSLLLAALGGLLTVALAFPLSFIIERSRKRGAGLLEFATLIPFAIPASTLGIGLIKVWNRTGIDLIYNSSCIILLGYVAHCIPFAIRVTSSGIKQVSSDLEEVACLSTGSRTRIMRKILLPLCSPSLLAGFFIAFVLSIGDLSTTILVIPPGRETIPLKIYNLMHYGAENLVAALCLILIGIILLFSLLFLILYRVGQRWRYAQS